MMNRPGDLKCTDVEVLLAEYAAGELSAAQAAAVSHHLDRCLACCAELAREQELRLTLESLPLVTCPKRATRALAADDGGDISGAQAPSNDLLGRNGRLKSRWAAAAGLAAAAVLLLVLLPGNGDDLVIDSDGRTWQRTELESARADLKWTLTLTVGVIDRTERNAMAEVFGRKLPQTITGSLRNVLNNVQGGQG